MITQDKTARIDLRVDAATKHMVERAADLLGQTVASFSVSKLTVAAQEVIDKYERVRLSDRDRDRFLEILDQEEQPNAALLKAAKRHSELVE